jgi:hypothetical protein
VWYSSCGARLLPAVVEPELTRCDDLEAVVFEVAGPCYVNHKVITIVALAEVVGGQCTTRQQVPPRMATECLLITMQLLPREEAYFVTQQCR